MCLAIIMATAVLGFRTALEAGQLWSDSTEIEMMNSMISIGAQSELSYEKSLQTMDRTSEDGGYYGVVTQYAAHALQTLVRGTASLQSICLRKPSLATPCFFCLHFFASLALFAAASTVTSDRRLGLAMVTALLSTPVFLGLSSIDDKDAPVAAGLTLLSSGIALLSWQLYRNPDEGPPREGEGARWATYLKAAVMISLGSLMAFGTRTGAGALIATQCAIAGLLFILALKQGVLQVAAAVGVLVLAVCAAAFIAIAINPLAQKAPLRWLIEGALLLGARTKYPRHAIGALWPYATVGYLALVVRAGLDQRRISCCISGIACAWRAWNNSIAMEQPHASSRGSLGALHRPGIDDSYVYCRFWSNTL